MKIRINDFHYLVLFDITISMRNLFGFLIIGLVLIGCKKNQDTNPDPAPPPCNGELISGHLSAANRITVDTVGANPQEHFVSGDLWAEFYSEPTCESSTTGKQIAVSGVWANGDSLLEINYPYGPPYYTHYEMELNHDYTHDAWTVFGGNNIPNFVFTDPDSLPVVIHPFAQFDSLDRNTGIS